MAWWNSNYKFRRRIKLSAIYDSIESDTIILFPFDTLAINEAGKLRSDYADIEVVKQDDTSFQIVSHSIDSNYVYFALANDMTLDSISDEEYYVYYGNPLLINALTNPNDAIINPAPINVYANIPNIPVKKDTVPPILAPSINVKAFIPYPVIIHSNARPTYSGDLWSTSLLPSDSHVSYTRPGEHWINGVSNTYNAIATVRFASDRIRMISKTGNYGIAEIRIDDEDWQDLNLYSSVSSNATIVYTRTSLTSEVHTLQFRVSGRTDLGSTDSTVNFIRFETLITGLLENLGEEFDPSIVWTSIFGGGN